MPVVFAALVPNSPFLLPGISLKIKQDLNKTIAGYNKLGHILKSTKAEVVFNISSLIESVDYYCLYQDKEFITRTEEFGDLLTHYEIKGAVGFTHSLKESIDPYFNIPLSTPKTLPLEQAIPLINLDVNQKLSSLIIPQFPSASDLISLSRLLADYFSSSRVRIAILASGVLARGKNYDINNDQKILNNIFSKHIKQGEYDDLNNIDMKLRVKNQESLIAPTAFIYNLVPSQQIQSSIIALEFTRGISHLLANISW